jgi:hypothetical protein
VLVVPHGYNEGKPVQDLDADGIVASLAAVADRVRKRYRRESMSFDLFDHQGPAGDARWPRTPDWRRWR